MFHESLTLYFDANEGLRDKFALRGKLLSLKANKIVTVFRYASGDILSTRQLIHAIFDSLTESLRITGCKFNGAKTLRGKIVAWFEADVANFQLFISQICNLKCRGVGAFAGKTAEEIIDLLQNSELSVDELVEAILTLGEC